MSKSQESRRHYTVASDYEIFEDAAALEPRRRAALLEFLYAEVCTEWRAALDTRMRLLALIPAAAVAAALLAPSDADTMSRQIGMVIASLLGFTVTCGAFIYERRNNQLYDDLISRGRRIEADLGIRTGVFRGRKRPQEGSIVSHGTGLGLIYWASLAAWAASALNAGYAIWGPLGTH